MRRNCLYFTLLLIILSCGRNEKHHDDRMVFNYNEMGDISSLDPAAASNFENTWAVNLLFNGLIQTDDSLRILPCIARTYSISPDGLMYTFILRTDVYFHDDACFTDGRGRKVTARDFVYSFNRLYEPGRSSAVTFLEKVNKNFPRGKGGVEAVDDSTFRIYLREPFSAFLSILTMKFFSVIPREVVTAYGAEIRSHPVGTGPFVFKAWDEGTKLIVLKNGKYFEKDSAGRNLPYLDAVTVSFIRERETAFMELLTGNLDMLSGADAFNSREVLDGDGDLKEAYTKRFYLQKQDFLKTDYIGILVDEAIPRVKSSPLRKKEVRQAINCGFDRKRLIRYLRNNLGEPAGAGFIPKGMSSYDPDAVTGYAYDPAKTADLLKKAGYPGGKGLPEMTLYITDGYKEQVEFIQSQLAASHIPVKVSVEKTAVLREAVNRGEYLLFKKSWVADYADEENFMSIFYSKNFTPKGSNFFHFKNSRFDSLYEAVQISTDPAHRKTLFRKMDRIIIDEAPVIPLYYDQVVRIVSRKINGLSSNSMNLLDLKSVTKKD